MATTTPNFGWSVPTSTDLVKDGATAIETLGDSIDASLVDLKGGTTGQVLAKNSGTDMDFIWVAQDDSNAIQNAIVDAKGDLISATAADTPARLAVGTNGQVLTADSTAATGLAWASAAASGGGMTLISTTSLSGSSTSLTSIAGTYKNLQLVIRDFYPSANADVSLTFNSDTASNYYQNGFSTNDTTNSLVTTQGTAVNFAWQNMNNTDENNTCVINIFDYASTVSGKAFQSTAIVRRAGQSYKVTTFLQGVYIDAAAISSIQIKTLSGTWSGGTALLYGVS